MFTLKAFEFKSACTLYKVSFDVEFDIFEITFYCKYVRKQYLRPYGVNITTFLYNNNIFYTSKYHNGCIINTQILPLLLNLIIYLENIKKLFYYLVFGISYSFDYFDR